MILFLNIGLLASLVIKRNRVNFSSKTIHHFDGSLAVFLVLGEFTRIHLISGSCNLIGRETGRLLLQPTPSSFFFFYFLYTPSPFLLFSCHCRRCLVMSKDISDPSSSTQWLGLSFIKSPTSCDVSRQRKFAIVADGHH